MLEFLEDPAAIYARHFGVSKLEYLAWVADDHSVRCAGKTVRGLACKSIVRGGANVEPQVWLAMQGACCNVHDSGSTSAYFLDTGGMLCRTSSSSMVLWPMTSARRSGTAAVLGAQEPALAPGCFAQRVIDR